MSSLEQLLAEVGLSEKPATSQTKTAAAAPSTSEVNKVLETLGILGGADAVKTASAIIPTQEKSNGGAMNFMNVYEEIFGGKTATAAAAAPADAPAAAGQTKVAEAEPTEEDESPSGIFGELVAQYFNCALSKLAGVVSDEANGGHDPMAAMPSGGQLTNVIGKPGDPRIGVNIQQSEKPITAAVKNSTPYALGLAATAKSYLKRVKPPQAGDIGTFSA